MIEKQIKKWIHNVFDIAGMLSKNVRDVGIRYARSARVGDAWSPYRHSVGTGLFSSGGKLP